MTMSKYKYLVLIVTISLQVCLLQAKNLRVTKQSVIVRNFRSNDQSDSKSETASANSSCSPFQHQLDHYNELYGANVANSFNGNTLHYALKAVEIHDNITESVVTVEDNAVVETITDQSRFTPAGMESANKVVCAKILQEMDAVTSSISSTALCGWDYICDYKPGRFPNYLFKARCKTAKCSSNCSQESNSHNMCQSHGIRITVLEIRGNCEAWVWGQELLPLACTCINNLMMKVT